MSGPILDSANGISGLHLLDFIIDSISGKKMGVILISSKVRHISINLYERLFDRLSEGDIILFKSSYTAKIKEEAQNCREYNHGTEHFRYTYAIERFIYLQSKYYSSNQALQIIATELGGISPKTVDSYLS